MTSCSEVEEVTDEEDGSKENCLGEMGKIVDALDATTICLN